MGRGQLTCLVAAARAVVNRLTNDLSSTSMSLVVADKQGHVVERSVGDGRLRSRLDRIMLAPGFIYRENCIGTNAIGTALEERAPSMVVGTEHFADALTEMACAAVPIFDPGTGSVLGAIDLTCAARGSLADACARQTLGTGNRAGSSCAQPGSRPALARALRTRAATYARPTGRLERSSDVHECARREAPERPGP
jgi:transcriptional regulator of acetoin/glycerol metabolism